MKIFPFAVFSMFLLFNACGDSASTGAGANTLNSLKAEATDVSMSVNYVRTVVVTGGNGRIRLHSISDSSVVNVYIGFPYEVNGKTFQDVRITSLKTGNSKITIRDSAGTSHVEINVTVALMVTSPRSVKVRVGREEYVSIMGGTKPLNVLTSPNSAIATVELTTFSSMYVTGVSPGRTSVIIRDSESPINHSIEIPIEVMADPKFFEQGTLSFNSSEGDFSATGVSVPNPAPALLSGEGAGGWLYHSFYAGELMTVMAYTMKDLTKFDLVYITLQKSSLSTGTVPIDTMYEDDEIASVGFAFDVDPSIEVPTFYRLTNGTVTLSMVSETYAAGNFSGMGIFYKDQLIVPGSSVTLNNGYFSVPLIDQTLSTASYVQKDNTIIAALRGIHEREVRRLMRQSVPLTK